MMASSKHFQPLHVMLQRQDVKLFFANRGNMRKNIARKTFRKNNIITSFQTFMATKFPAIRLSTYLTTYNSDRAFKNFSLHIMFEGTVAELKLRSYRKYIEAASGFPFARTEKLGRWRGIERGMSAKRPGRMRRTRMRHLRRRSMCWRHRQPPDRSRDRFRTPRGRC